MKYLLLWYEYGYGYGHGYRSGLWLGLGLLLGPELRSRPAIPSLWLQVLGVQQQQQLLLQTIASA